MLREPADRAAGDAPAGGLALLGRLLAGDILRLVLAVAALTLLLYALGIG